MNNILVNNTTEKIRELRESNNLDMAILLTELRDHYVNSERWGAIARRGSSETIDMFKREHLDYCDCPVCDESKR